MKHLLHSLAITLCLAFIVTAAQAQTITAEQAREIANSFFSNGKQKSTAARSTAAVSLKNSADSRILTSESSSDAPTFHILTPASGEGFVIVAGEEIGNPIIGYSFEGTIDTSDLPVGFADYMAGIDAQVKALRKYNAENPQKTAAARSAMQKTNYAATTMGDKVHLETASWGQNTPFNDQCWTSTEQTVHAKTGCVPTAYAIIMRYHEWPLEGTGNLVNCQSGAEITDRTYDYSKMPLVYDGNWSTEQINEVAKLMSHLGHAFMVTFGSGSTSVSDPQSTDKPNKFFNYNLVYASYQENFTIDAWKEKIKESIDNGCPIPYASDNAGTGDTRHMFVLDGYTANDYFHFNFGWSGGGNGWFKLDAIKPSTGDDYSWQDGADHYAIFNFTPNKTKYAVNASVSPENAGTVSINGGAAASTSTGEYLEGATVTLAATANTGYTFSHWSKGTGTETETVSTSKNCQVKVASSGNDYVANFLTVGNTTVDVTVSYNSSYGTVSGTNGTVANNTTLTPLQNEEVTLTATPLDGYIFTGWTVTKGTESTNYSGTSLTFVATGEMSVTANFALAVVDYNMIISNVSPSGSSTGARNSTWTYNTDNNYPAALKLQSTNGSTEVYGLSNTYNRLYAYVYDANNTGYSSATYTLSVPDGYVITGYSMTYYVGSSYTGQVTVSNGTTTETPSNTNYHYLTATPNAQTAEFTISASQAGQQYITIVSFTVTVMKDDGAGSGTTPPATTTYTITATADPATAGSVTGGGTYNEGAAVTLTATPKSGYTFKNWTNNLNTDVVTENPYTVTATADVTYTATFQEAATTQYTITATASPATAGSVTGGGTYNEGAAVTLTATPKSGYTFKNWTNNLNTDVVTENPYTVTATADVTYTAIFQEAEATTPAVDLSGRYFRLKTLRSNEYMNILDYEDHNGAFGGVNVTALDASNNDQIFYFTKSDESYKLKSLTNHYLYNDFSNSGYWNVNANSTSDSECMLLTFEPTTEELQYLISCTKGYFMSGPVASGGGGNGSNYVYCDTPEKANADTWLLEEVKYTITATATEGGTAKVATGGGEGAASVEVSYDGSATLTATPASGYSFVNWTKEGVFASGDAEFTVNNVKADAEYVANFEKEAAATVDLSGKYYRLKVKNTSNYMNIANNTYNDGSTSGIITAAKETNKDAQIFYFTKSSDSYKLQARTGYYITCHAWNANANSNSDGTELTFEPTGNELEYLIKWNNDTKDNQGNERDDYFKVENNYVYCDAASTAASTWVLEEVALCTITATANPVDAGTATVAAGNGAGASSVTVEQGTSVTLTAAANAGYDFASWTNDLNTDIITESSCIVTATADAQYTAKFQPQPVTYTISVSATEGGTAYIGNGTTTEVEVTDGNPVTLTAEAYTGYKFAGWYMNGQSVSDEASYTFVPTESASYEAQFEKEATTPVIYTISVSATNGGTATVATGTEAGSSSIEVEAGTIVTFTATPDDGYNFVNWTSGTSEISTNATFTIEATASVEYVANFEEAPAAGGGTETVYNIVTNDSSGSTDEQNPDSNVNSYYKVWNYGSSPKITITSSDYTITDNESAINLRAATYTITAPDGFEIVSYTINFKALESSTINGKSYEKANNLTHTEENINASSAEFSVSTATTGRYIQISSIDMVLRATGYTINVVAGEGGNAYVGETGTATQATITAGESVTLRAEAKEGYEFDGWYNSNGKFISDAATYSITPNDNMTYTARFYALLRADKYYRFQCQGSNKYYLSSNMSGTENDRLVMNGENRIFYYGTLINEFDEVDNSIEASQKKLLAYTEGNFVGVKKRATEEYYDVTLLDNRYEISHNVKFNAGTDENVMIGVEYVDADENSIYFYLDGNGSTVSSSTNVIKDNAHNWACEEVTSLPVTIYDVQHATLYAPVALEIPDGVRAYVLDASNIDGTSKDILLTRLSSIIPANTGVILKGNAGTYDFKITNSTDEAENEAAGNALAGTVARTRVVGDAYILSEREGKIGLYPLSTNSYLPNQSVATASFTNGSHKAYLPVKDDTLGEILKKGAGIRFLFSDEIVTNIDEVNPENGNAETIYDLQGRKLSEITEPGIYIVNGKKVFIK